MELTEQEKSSALAGGPGTLQIGDTCFLIDHYTTALVFTVFEWAMEKARKSFNPVRETLDMLAGVDSVDPAAVKEMLVAAAAVKRSGELPGELITRCLRSREGVAMQLWALTRTHHADLSHEDCQRLVTEENRIDVYVGLDQASGANIILKAVVDSGFFPPASSPGSTGLSPTVGMD
jgi:hypothetical protein